MSMYSDLQRDYDRSMSQLGAMNYVLTKTYEALSRYDPARNAAPARAEEDHHE